MSKLTAVYVLADKLGDAISGNIITDEITAFMGTKGAVTPLCTRVLAESIYKNTVDTSPLR